MGKGRKKEISSEVQVTKERPRPGQAERTGNDAQSNYTRFECAVVHLIFGVHQCCEGLCAQ